MLATIAVFDLIKDDLQRVETRLHDIPLRSEADFESGDRGDRAFVGRGGKRIRPALTLLTGRLYPSDPRQDHFAGRGGRDAAHGHAGA